MDFDYVFQMGLDGFDEVGCVVVDFFGVGFWCDVYQVCVVQQFGVRLFGCVIFVIYCYGYFNRRGDGSLGCM